MRGVNFDGADGSFHAVTDPRHPHDRELSAWLDGESSAADAAHIEGCDRCQRRARQLGAADDGLLALLDPPSPRRADALLAALGAGASPSPASARQQPQLRALPAAPRPAPTIARPARRTPPAFLAAAALLLIALVGVLASREARRDSSEPGIASSEPPHHHESPGEAVKVRLGLQPLPAALASWSALPETPRQRWLAQLQLPAEAQAQLIADVRSGGPARELALAWWLAHPTRQPREALLAIAGQPAIDGLLLALASADPPARRRRLLERLCLASGATPTIEALVADQGHRAAPLLAELLARPARRAAAAAALRRLGEPALRPLSRQLMTLARRAASGREGAAAARAEASALIAFLQRHPAPQAREALIASLRASDWTLREAALTSLARRPEPEADDALRRQLSQPALAELAAQLVVGKPGGVADVARQLRSRDARLGRAALAALANTAGDEAGLAIARAVNHPTLTDAVHAALARQGSAAALEALRRRARDPRQRRSVYRALASHGGEPGVAILAEQGAHPARARDLLGVLTITPTAETLPAIASALRHPRLRRRALQAIVRIESPRSIPYLIRALDHPTLRLRAHHELVSRTGQRLPAQRAQWSAWLEFIRRLGLIDLTA